MDDTITFQNMDSWKGGGSGKFGLTFKQIVLMHINRCVTNGSVEWHGGYWETRTTSQGGASVSERRYVPNTRSVYINSIRILRALLVGYFDKKMRIKDKPLMSELKQIKLKKKEAKDKEEIADLRDLEVETSIKLFEQLIKLSKRLNFFEEESVEEEL